MRMRIALVAALTMVTALVSGASAQAVTRLVGTVGPGFDIAVKTRSGKRVTLLPRGAVVLVVRDRSSIHDFHLKGPGVDRIVTTVGFVGTKTIRLKLKPGRYTYVCDPHAFAMHGGFRVR